MLDRDLIAIIQITTDQAQAIERQAARCASYVGQVAAGAAEIERLRLLLTGAARGVDHVMDQIKREFGSQFAPVETDDA